MQRNPALPCFQSYCQPLTESKKAATGCSPLRGTLNWAERNQEHLPWHVRLVLGANFVEFNLVRLDWPDASAVMNAKESELLSAFSKSPSVAHPQLAAPLSAATIV